MMDSGPPIPDDIRREADGIAADLPTSVRPMQRGFAADCIARAIMAERARWQPAVAYFNAYCLDEEEDADNCLEPAQHEAAKAFGRVVRGEAA